MESREIRVKWFAPMDVGSRIVDILRRSYNLNQIDFGTSLFSFNFVYNQRIQRLVSLKPIISQYMDLMQSNELTEISKYIFWVILFDIVDPSQIEKDIHVMYKQLYDRLSVQFSDLRKKLSIISSVANERLIDYWSIAISATLLQLIIGEFSETELAFNHRFVETVEEGVRILLTGFPSSNSNYFHQLVWSLLSPKSHRLIPKKLIPQLKSIPYVNSTTATHELTNAMQLEGHYKELDRHGSDVLFHENTKTGLIQNALKLSGTRDAFEQKGRLVRKGNAEKSDILSKKANAIMKTTQRIINRHIVNRNLQLYEIWDKKPEILEFYHKQEDFPLNTFGYDPIKNFLTVADNVKHDIGEKRVARIPTVYSENAPKPDKSSEHKIAVTKIIETIDAIHSDFMRTGFSCPRPIKK